MPLKIKSTSGSVTLSAENVAGDQTLTVPSQSGATLQTTADTITSSRLSGALPAISGASLTNLPAGGVDGIVSSANATAITITSTELVGIGMTPTTRKLEVNDTIRCKAGEGFEFGGNVNGVYNTSNDIFIKTNSNERFRVTSDGRGLSQFTAKVWCNFKGSGTVNIRDSHNVSSITDSGVGVHYVNHQYSLASTSSAAVASCSQAGSYAVVNMDDIDDYRTRCTSSRTDQETQVDPNVVCLLVFGD